MPKHELSEAQWYQLDDEMRRSQGWKITLARSRIRDTYYAFWRNYKALREHLDRYEQDTITLDRLYVEGDLSLDKGMRELNRLALNYLGSAVALREHTETELRDSLRGLSPMGDYFRRQVRDYEPGLRWFMEGLRNFAMHHGLPLNRTEVTGQPDKTVAVVIALDEERLRERIKQYWKGDKPGREYLRQFPDGRNVAELFEEHEAATKQLYEWLGAQIQEHFAVELGRLEETARKLGLTS